MKLSYHRHFLKAYKKLPKRIQQATDEKLLLFLQNPFHERLNNHHLHGEYRLYRSLDITGNFRALYRTMEGENVMFVFVGTHHQLYGS